MKNLKGLLVFVFVCVLLVTGCGKKKNSDGDSEKLLTCTISGPTATVTRAFTFDKEGKHLLLAETTRVGNYTDKDELEADYDDAQEYCKTVNEYKGVACSVTKSNETVTLVVKIDYAVADADTLSIYAMEPDYSFDQLKQEGEEYGWTCK